MPDTPSLSARLIVAGLGQTRTLALPAHTVTVGRSPDCEVVLDDPEVSRSHARLYLDPFGRWIVQDLHSRNGVWVGGRQVARHPLGVGESVEIGPFELSIAEGPEDPIPPEVRPAPALAAVEDDHDTTITAARADSGEPLPADLIQRFNAVAKRLARLTCPEQIYPTLCRALAASEDSAAAVLRLPEAPQPLPDAAQLLAFRVGRRMGRAPPPEAPVRLSRRVLEAVRNDPVPVAASSVRSPGAELQLTVVDAQHPRTVLCAPIGEAFAPRDILYVDLASDLAGPTTLDFLQAVARHVGYVRTALLRAETSAERRVLDRQLLLARRIQARLIPPPFRRLPGAEVAVCYQPAMWVGGDYCDFWPVADGRLAFAVGDVSGKGLSAAMVMASLQAALRGTTEFCQDLDRVMRQVNRLLCHNLPAEMFVTLFVGLFDPPTRRLEYVNAGHLLPLLVPRPGEVVPFGEPRHIPLGIQETSFRADRQTLPPGAALVVVTDGVTDARSPAGQPFGLRRLRNTLAAAEGNSSRQLVGAVNAAVTAFRRGLPARDDLTVLALTHCAE